MKINNLAPFKHKHLTFLHCMV